MNVSHPLSFKAKAFLYPVSILHRVIEKACTMKRSSPVPTEFMLGLPINSQSRGCEMVQWVNVPVLPS